MSDESVQAVAVQILELTSKIIAQGIKIEALETRIATLEVQSSQADEAAKTDKALSNTMKKRRLPPGLPKGTVAARDFYIEKGLSEVDLRHHAERGIYDDFLETTEVPHKTRPGFKYRYLTPDQQKKTIEYWDTHGIDYKK